MNMNLTTARNVWLRAMNFPAPTHRRPEAYSPDLAAGSPLVEGGPLGGLYVGRAEEVGAL
jgi:hypothetical protein